MNYHKDDQQSRLRSFDARCPVPRRLLTPVTIRSILKSVWGSFLLNYGPNPNFGQGQFTLERIECPEVPRRWCFKRIEWFVAESTWTKPAGPSSVSFHNEQTTKSPRPSSNSSPNVAHRKRSAEVKVISVHSGYSQHTQSCRLLIGSELRHVTKRDKWLGHAHTWSKALMCRIRLNSEMGGIKQTQRCYFYIQPCCSWSRNEMCCVQKQRLITYTLLNFSLLQRIKVSFLSLSIYKNFLQWVSHDKCSSNE